MRASSYIRKTFPVDARFGFSAVKKEQQDKKEEREGEGRVFCFIPYSEIITNYGPCCSNYRLTKSIPFTVQMAFRRPKHKVKTCFNPAQLVSYSGPRCIGQYTTNELKLVCKFTNVTGTGTVHSTM